MDLVLFPNQLFEPKVIENCFLNVATIQTIYFIEDPVFYGDRKGSPHANKLNLNTLRLLMMYILHKNYIQILQKHFKVVYIPIEQLWNKINYSFLPKECLIIDPCDHLLMNRLKKTNINWTIIESPSFLFTRSDLQSYMIGRENKHLQHSSFYEFSKDKLQLLKGIKNLDIYNREPYKKDIVYPPNPYRYTYSTIDNWNDAVIWLENSPFKNNYHPNKNYLELITNYLIHLPITHLDVKKWLNDFLKNRLHLYGKYQDVVIPEQALLYHSGLSIYLNNGMITPSEIIKKIKLYPTDIQNYEGFIRQIIGWREYTRLYYLYISPKIYRKNIFGLPKKQLSKMWYLGTTNIPVVDKTIQNAFNYGYINHIQRLMVIANYMTLNEVHPDNIYKWMYEFSLDSYDWVMVFNCYSMGSWSDNGYAMRKPYISSSNYILKMTNESKGEWQEKWDVIYRGFINKHKNILKHTQLANLIIST